MKIVLVTGGFDPLHSGHIAYFNAAKMLGNILIVGINSDDWLTRKKGKAFMPLSEREAIVKNLRMVDYVISFDDTDDSAKQAIASVRARWPANTIVFANGGDRTQDNIPEMSVQDSNLEFAFGVGGEDKQNSSSWILEEWKSANVVRPWGCYRILHQYGKEIKVKELTVAPGQCLSMQKHEERAEHWFIAEGTAEVYTVNKSSDHELIGVFKRHQSLHVKKGEWHQLCNPFNEPLRIVEIQYGTNCVEEDIQRKFLQ